MARLVTILAAPLLLVSCLLTPGKFVSTLDIGSDRSFTFTYAGEAILIDPEQNVSISSDPEAEGGDYSAPEESAPPAPAVETAELRAKREAIAEALRKEQGYRSVQYLGDGLYRVNYAISGRLDRAFVYPFNSDAAAIFPWIAIELRQDGTARIKAPAFGEGETEGVIPTPTSPMDKAVERREGTFTLTTDAELVMQNNEAGAEPGPGTKIVWRVTPASRTVPTAVVRFAGSRGQKD
ncbi:hypothetical protein ACFQRC_06140 [Enterovirga sp. GCM10030262]|uniref:hypothetical protein n=1 Tax=Enterovirga sp. GCM10030262 TaxID=3273391 RepID=UPI0036204108